MSQRSAAKLLNIPKSTLHDWKQSERVEYKALNRFFSTVEGTQFLHRIVNAAHFVIQYRGKGFRSTGEFLELSGLSAWVACSEGALYRFSKNFEHKIIQAGAEQREKFAKKMQKQKVVICQDETFHKGKPCLVAIDALSNYIFAEEYSEKRSVEAWDRVMEDAFNGLQVDVVSATSDEGTAILSHVKRTLGVEHSPDIFHVQQEVSKSCSAPLKAQEQSFQSKHDTCQAKLAKVESKKGEMCPQAGELRKELRLRKYGLEQRQERRFRLREAIKGIGKDYHPVDLKTGSIQSVEGICSSLKTRFDEILKIATEADLNFRSLKQVAKAAKMIEPLKRYLFFFFLMLKDFTEKLFLDKEEASFFTGTLFPLAYMERIMNGMNKKAQVELQPVIDQLQCRVREGPIQGTRLEWLQGKAQELAHLFQRSSSCVEGRNGMLSMMHHGFHGLSDSRLKALTVIHNYHAKRRDGSTAAGRFFGKEPDSLFERIVQTTRIPGKPRRTRASCKQGKELEDQNASYTELVA